ncbi:MAG: sugar phosphate isomerase/epimerase, partial [Clostridiales bacterium]|nr:sugar phosphate isomerase/epimerase [Clostridiales bacterium]
MKLGLFNSALNNYTFEETCKILAENGIQMIELGAGGVSYTSHVDPDALLNSDETFTQFENTIKKYGLGVSAIACHGNPLHPNKASREIYD